jgi:hypothetical protein
LSCHVLEKPYRKKKILLLMPGFLLGIAFGACEGKEVYGSGIDKPGQPAIQSPPPGCLYHGVFAGPPGNLQDEITRAEIASYEQAVGKRAAWVYFSNHWFSQRTFPAETAAWIRASGSVPYIRLMLWSSPEQNREEKQFTLPRILKGDFDEDFRSWGRAAAAFGSPVIAEFGTEVNGKWYPWNGWWNGQEETAQYGDPAIPDGPERFRDAYRRIITLMRAAGARNITWVFHVNYNESPQALWNRFENYYPGDDVIDWIGVSVYGAQQPGNNQWPEFRAIMDGVYPRLAALSSSRPIIIAELGATRDNILGSQALWAQRALSDLASNRWPRVIGFAWFNQSWQNDSNPQNDTSMRVQDNPSLAVVFQEQVGKNKKILGTIIMK